MRGNGWERVTFESKNSTFEQDLIFLREKLGRRRNGFRVLHVASKWSIDSSDDEPRNIPIKPSGMVKQPLSDAVLDFGNCIAKLFRHRLSLEGFNCIRVRCSGHDDERDNGDGRADLLQTEVET